MHSSRNPSRRDAKLVPIVAAGALALLLSGSTPAHAGGVGVRGSWVDTPDGAGNTGMVGGFFRMGRIVALEGAVDYRREEPLTGVEMTTWPATLSLVVSPVPVAYGVAGIGWYNTKVELTDTLGGLEDTTTEFGYHVGAGVELPIVPALSFEGDLRYSFVDYDFDEFAEAVSNLDGGNYLALNLGLMVKLPVGAG